ncbi:hypothetical protein CPC08DRAFT_121445 [Agrocybe pediades]|nr:hypothetical protein CPC08DRAFT_121445 [Agrocybe pediades]
MRRDLPFLVCGEFKSANMDVSIVDDEQGDILLLVLVQEYRHPEDAPPCDPLSQLVANALAAFTESNEHRILRRLPPLKSKIMAGIVMDGTVPTFFKIPVSQELVAHVQHGTYPPTPTVVTYCSPPVPHPARLSIDGMKPLSNRRPILSCFEAFKSIVGI